MTCIHNYIDFISKNFASADGLFLRCLSSSESAVFNLLNDELNPFTWEKLTVDDLVPATDVKEKIDNWIKEQRAKTAASMNRDTSA